VTYGDDMTFQTPPWPRPHTHLSFKVRPGIDAHRPFVYLLTGSIARTATVPTGYGCHGTVTVSYWQGRQQLASRVVPVGLTTCTFRARFSFRHIQGVGARRLTVRARYFGDEWDAPSVHKATVWAG
jgi:hypothetical protein